MVTLQFWRGLNKECLLSVTDQKTYKIVELGYPLLSFLSDIDIDICQESDEISHVYWGAEEIRNGANPFAAKMCQSMLRETLDARIQNDQVLDLKMFEDIAISCGFEIPSHGISKQTVNGTEIVCDLYRCFYVPGITREIIEQLCVAELHYLATNGYTIKRCANCGKLFIPKKADEKYCTRRSDEYQNMNCKQAAKYKKQVLREGKSESARLYHSIYTAMARRAKTAPLSTQSQMQEELYAFADKAADWKKRLKADPKLDPQYIAWLNSFKKRNTKSKNARTMKK